jgi:O-antigen ligase
VSAKTKQSQVTRTPTERLPKWPFWLLLLFTAAIGGLARDVAKLGLPAPVPGGTLYITEVVLGLLLATVGLRWLTAGKNAAQKNRVMLRVLMPLALLFIIAALNLARSDWSYPSFVIREVATIYYILFLPLTILIVRTRRRAQLAFFVLAGGGLLGIGHVLFRWLAGTVGTTSTGALRYGNAEISVIFILIAYLFTRPMRRWPALNRMLLLLSSATVVLLIQHRSATLALIVVLSLLTLTGAKAPGKSVLKSLVAGLIMGLVFLYFAWVFDSDILKITLTRIESIAAPTDDANATMRMDYWQLALSSMAIPVDWLIGTGWGALLVYNPMQLDLSNEYLLVTGFHNSPLYILFHTGLLGLGALMWPLVTVWRDALKNRSRARTASPAQALLGANLALFFFSLFNVVLEVPYNAVVFWVVVGLMVLLNRAPEDEEQDFTTSPPPKT